MGYKITYAAPPQHVWCLIFPTHGESNRMLLSSIEAFCSVWEEEKKKRLLALYNIGHCHRVDNATNFLDCLNICTESYYLETPQSQADQDNGSSLHFICLLCHSSFSIFVVNYGNLNVHPIVYTVVFLYYKQPSKVNY